MYVSGSDHAHLGQFAENDHFMAPVPLCAQGQSAEKERGCVLGFNKTFRKVEAALTLHAMIEVQRVQNGKSQTIAWAALPLFQQRDGRLALCAGKFRLPLYKPPLGSPSYLARELPASDAIPVLALCVRVEPGMNPEPPPLATALPQFMPSVRDYSASPGDAQARDTPAFPQQASAFTSKAAVKPSLPPRAPSSAALDAPFDQTTDALPMPAMSKQTLPAPPVLAMQPPSSRAVATPAAAPLPSGRAPSARQQLAPGNVVIVCFAVTAWMFSFLCDDVVRRGYAGACGGLPATDCATCQPPKGHNRIRHSTGALICHSGAPCSHVSSSGAFGDVRCCHRGGSHKQQSIFPRRCKRSAHL